jgi:hypothetical protein
MPVTTDYPNCTPCCQPPPIDTTCCANDFPQTLWANIADGTGNCACANAAADIQLTYNAGTGKWSGSDTVCGVVMSIDFYCVVGGTSVLNLRMDISYSAGCLNCSNASQNPGATCNPLSVTFICGQGASSCCTGAFGVMTVTVTE